MSDVERDKALAEYEAGIRATGTSVPNAFAAGFTSGWDAHAAQAVSLPDRDELRKALTTVRGIVKRNYGDAHDILSIIDIALSTQPAAGEGEWEYNIAFPETTSEGVVWWNPDGAEPSDSIEIVRDDLASGSYLDSDRIVRRRKAGPWIEVQPEPTPELAELFPGTLAALDRLGIRPEVQS